MHLQCSGILWTTSYWLIAQQFMSWADFHYHITVLFWWQYVNLHAAQCLAHLFSWVNLPDLLAPRKIIRTGKSWKGNETAKTLRAPSLWEDCKVFNCFHSLMSRLLNTLNTAFLLDWFLEIPTISDLVNTYSESITDLTECKALHCFLFLKAQSFV